MSDAKFRVLRFDRWQDPSYAERLAREPLVELVDIKMAQPEAQSWAALESCHCYQASSARDASSATNEQNDRENDQQMCEHYDLASVGLGPRPPGLRGRRRLRRWACASRCACPRT